MNFCIVAQNLRLKWSQKYSAWPNYAVLRMVLWVHFVELITRWKAERKSTFHIPIYAHIYKEMQFLYIYTYTCIYSQQDTCQYKKCICMQWYWSFPLHGNRADWDLILSWKKTKTKNRFGNQTEGSWNLTSSVEGRCCITDRHAETPRGAVKGCNRRCWDVSGPQTGGSEDIYWVEPQHRNAKFLPPDLVLESIEYFSPKGAGTQSLCGVFKI